MAEDDTLSWDDILAGRLAGQEKKAANQAQVDDTLMGLPPLPTKPAPTAPDSPPTLTGGPALSIPEDTVTFAGEFLPQPAASPRSPAAQLSAAPAAQLSAAPTLAGAAIPMTGIGVQEREALRVLSPEEDRQLRDYLQVRRRKRGARGAVSLLLSFLVLASASAACFLWDPLHVWSSPALTAADQLHLDAFAPPWQPPPAADPDPLGIASP